MEQKQAAETYRKMTAAQKKALENNLAQELMFESEEVRWAVLRCMGNVSPELEKNLTKTLSF